MSLNAYLDIEKAEKAPDYTVQTKSDGKGGTCQERKLNGNHVFGSDGRYHIIVSSSMKTVPDSLRDLVVGFSMHEDFPIQPSRERGVYEHETAKAELETRNSNGRVEAHMVQIEGKELAHVWELLELIKTGAIRPTKSYDNRQVPGGMPPEEQIDGLHRTIETLERQLEDAHDVLADNFSDERRRTSKLLDELDDMCTGNWPFCTKSRAKKALTEYRDCKTE